MPLPFLIPAAFFSSSDAGGVLRMKVKLRSSKTEISTGMISPFLSLVRALCSLQNIMMFTPAAPSAGPTGGAGFAEPAASASLMIFVTFFAIIAGAGARSCRRRALGVAGAIAGRAASMLLLRATPAAGVAPKLEADEGRQTSSVADRNLYSGDIGADADRRRGTTARKGLA